MSSNQVFEYLHGNYRVLCLVCKTKWKQNTYVVQELLSKDIFVIDPGAASGKIVEAIEELGGELKGVYLTHGHHDHVAGVDDLYQKYGLKAYLKKEDQRLIRRAPLYAYRFEGRSLQPVENYEVYSLANEFEAELPFQILSVPGHTRGGVCFIFSDFVFTGDLLFYKKIGRTDLPGGDRGEIGQSIKYLLEELDDGQVIYPGHGKPWEASEAKSWWMDSKTEKMPHNSFDDDIIKER
jgi:glyoxylase-like metal-dependent hydrolase (beta-lactamase superfamily II)